MLVGQLPADGHTLLIRRSVSDPAEVEFFLAHALAGTPVTELIGVAGLCWKIEENNETGKDLLGLTEYRVRKRDGWHRHVTTAMLALAFSLSAAHSRLIRSPLSRSCSPSTREKALAAWPGEQSPEHQEGLSDEGEFWGRTGSQAELLTAWAKTSAAVAACSRMT
ncbi:hypothetical protein OHA77_16370 [Streptosporangium sp. NBC_01639]|uniref:hypothetical protein n=1 Tax=Streptosporangium sp. NBC_01639 TaxID=2975948 RepID=UPI003869F18D|nr:hypothetical protein OHA77_16370 [Streptosporangium sp. NBC_01639]